MLRFGKQKAVVRKALIQMSLCTSPSPKATATCSTPKNMEKLVRGHWRQRPSFSVSWFPGRAAALIRFLKALGTYTLSCAVFHSEHDHTLLWRKQPLKKKPCWGVPGRLQHSHGHGSFFERDGLVSGSWTLNLSQLTAQRFYSPQPQLWLLFSCSVVSYSLWQYKLQHVRLPCPSPSPRVCSNSCPLSWWCHPTISSSATPASLPALNLSHHQGLFRWVSSTHQVAKVLEVQRQHQSFQWIFRVDFLWNDWFDLLAVQGTLQSLLQHHSSKASILWHSALFIVQLSHLYMTIGKTIALTIRTFVSKVIYLLFNMLPRFVIAFLPRSKCLLISWLQSSSAMILAPKKIKSVIVSIFSPYLTWSDGTGFHGRSA